MTSQRRSKLWPLDKGRDITEATGEHILDNEPESKHAGGLESIRRCLRTTCHLGDELVVGGVVTTVGVDQEVVTQ